MVRSISKTEPDMQFTPPEADLFEGDTLGVSKRQTGIVPTLIFTLTVLYLAVELAFNSHLLDVVSQNPTENEIHAVEYYGRLFSGLAMALAIFPVVIKFSRMLRIGAREIVSGLPLVALGLMIPVIALSIELSSYLQEKIVHNIETFSSSDTRRTANLLLLINDGLQSDAISFDGIDLSAQKRDLPETKALFALMPALYLSIDDAFSDLSPNTRTILSTRIVPQVEEVSLYKGYIEASNKAASLFEDYQSLQAEIPGLEAQVNHATAAITAEVDWFLKSAGVAGGSCDVSAMYSDAVRGMLHRKRGIKLPDNWTLCDIGSIRKQIRSQLMINTQDEITSNIRSIVGFSLPLGLTYNEFMSQPKVLSKACNEIAVDVDCSSFAFGYSEKQFQKAVVDKLVQKRISEGVSHYLSDRRSFDNGQENDEAGYSAIRIAYVPLVAFIFSLSGIWVHLVKSSYYAVLALKLPRSIGVVTAACMLTFLGFAPIVYSSPNHILSSDFYENLMDKRSSEFEPSLAYATRSIIRWQPTLYPAGNAIKHVLGLSFGS